MGGQRHSGEPGTNPHAPEDSHSAVVAGSNPSTPQARCSATKRLPETHDVTQSNNANPPRSGSGRTFWPIGFPDQSPMPWNLDALTSRQGRVARTILICYPLQYRGGFLAAAKQREKWSEMMGCYLGANRPPVWEFILASERRSGKLGRRARHEDSAHQRPLHEQTEVNPVRHPEGKFLGLGRRAVAQ
jgi:hypothetical protein